MQEVQTTATSLLLNTSNYPEIMERLEVSKQQMYSFSVPRFFFLCVCVLFILLEDIKSSSETSLEIFSGYMTRVSLSYFIFPRSPRERFNICSVDRHTGFMHIYHMQRTTFHRSHRPLQP